MDPIAARSGGNGPEFHSQFEGEFHGLVSMPPENSSSFTALLELPANQAMELLVDESPPEIPLLAPSSEPFNANPPIHLPPSIFPSETALVVCSEENSIANLEPVKQEPVNSGSDPFSPALSANPTIYDNQKPTTKRKEREKKGKESGKKSKKAATETSEEGGEKLPYVHVRARRGQATDSHSLAERARREKINARMKLLQELVPGCNKISGTALVLDEIINHVQSLQRQVEFLSMRLAAVNPRIDFNLETLLAAESGSPVDNNYIGMVMPSIWPEVPMHGNRQEYQQQWHVNELHQPVWGRDEDNSNFITPANSLFSYDSSGNSAPLPSNPLKMEL